jgi:hypothetical protein
VPKDCLKNDGFVTFHAVGGRLSNSHNGKTFPSFVEFWRASFAILGSGWGRKLTARGDLVEVRREMDCFGDWVVLAFAVRDECGLAIPAHEVIAAFARLDAAENRARRMSWRARRHPGGYRFRAGHVPGLRKWSLRGLSSNPRVRAEVASNALLRYDEECAAHGVAARPSRGRPWLMDSCYDEWDRARGGRSWKRHRRHQWKG